jgi:hypothetical protein
MLLDRDDLDQPVRRTPPDLRYSHTLLQCIVSSDPSDPYVLGRLDPSVIQRYGIRILLSSGKNSKKNPDSYCFVTSF